MGIYIHIPFCDKICPYCDFYSTCSKDEFDKYTHELIKRITYFGEKHKRLVDTIYFGGGTPSVLGTRRLCDILENIKNSFIVKEDVEVTVEVNPCSSNNIDFLKLKSAGFNRLSIGMQSSNSDELKLLGRRHKAQDVKSTISAARDAGFDNISLDLMICVPNQTKNSLTESIRFCKSCDVEHVSAYILKIEKNTTFYSIKDKLNLFDDDTQAQLYMHVVNELEKHGYYQYEISNFSEKGYESKHNLRYWQCKEYLGIGPSAHSFLDGKRFYYPRSLDDFYNNIIVHDGAGGEIDEFIMLNLRLKKGLGLKSLNKKYNYIANKNFLTRINQLKREELIEVNDDNISLTKKGFLVSNSIINYIIDNL